MVKLTKSAILAAVKSAVKQALVSKGYVQVNLPGWEDYELAAYRARMSKVQQYPSTMIRVVHKTTRISVWSTTAGYLDSISKDMAKRFVDCGGALPISATHIPCTHAAFTSRF